MQRLQNHAAGMYTKLKKDIYENSFLYKGGQVWNCLPDVLKDSQNNFEAFEYYY